MRMRTLTATVLTAGVLAPGAGAAVASADDAPAPAPAAPGQPAAPKICASAGDRINRLQTRETKIQAGIDKLHRRLDKANADNHPKVAARVQAAISKRQQAHDRVDDRIGRLKETCHIA